MTYILHVKACTLSPQYSHKSSETNENDKFAATYLYILRDVSHTRRLLNLEL